MILQYLKEGFRMVKSIDGNNFEPIRQNEFLTILI
jgi:hypothetical protein